MKRFTATLAVALALSMTGMAAAADYSSPVGEGDGYALCAGVYVSPLLTTSNAAQLQAEVTHRYNRALAVSLRPRTVDVDTALFTWATEATVACGKALGFFASRRIDAAQISQCDCYYHRMSRRLQ